MTVRSASPLDAAAFAALMAAFEPFERHPHIAVACSGGADSLALAICAARWAADRDGRVTALVVDHGLRAEAAQEAAATRRRLARLGIRAVVLRGSVAGPGRDLQQQARVLRYRLMEAWCAARGVLHLLVAHHQEDQAETLLLRLGRGSGVDGLSAMAGETARGAVRVLRPLLTVPRAHLHALSDAAGLGYVEDPSNRDPAFARVRMRALARALGEEGLTADRLAATARRLGRARAALEETVNGCLGRHVGLYPAGYCVIAPALLDDAPEEIALRALSRTVACIAGAAYPPRLERIERLYAALRAGGPGRGRTVAGARIVPHDGAYLVFREAAAMEPPLRLEGPTHWDGRFLAQAGAPAGWRIGGLGTDGVARLGDAKPAQGATWPPRPLWPSLPAFWHRGQPKVVPHLGVMRVNLGKARALRLAFSPKRPLGAAIFNFS